MAEPEITIKNTKAEILEALNYALKKAELMEMRLLNPEKEELVKHNKKAVETAEKAVQENIFSNELNEKFNSLQVALSAEENRLQELYGVGREVQKLALVIEASREKIAEIELDKAEKEDAWKKSLEKLNDEFAQKNSELQTAHDVYLKNTKNEQTREKEEYQYSLLRTRERENNAWDDEKTERENELKKQETHACELLKEAQSKVGHLQTLEETVENIPELIASEKEQAIALNTEMLNKEYAHKAALAKMECQNAVGRLEDRVEFFENALEASNKSAGVLQGKLDKAYSEIRDLATKTVESAGSVKIIGNSEKSSLG